MWTEWLAFVIGLLMFVNLVILRRPDNPIDYVIGIPLSLILMGALPWTHRRR
jgi:hypothetical protein